MKEKIILALKNKHKNLGFSEKTFLAVADFLSTSVTEESQIETAVDGVENLLKTFQSDADTRVTTAVNKVKTETKDKGADPTTTEPTSDKDVPEWAKGLIEANKTLLTEVTALKQGKATESRMSILDGELKDVPEAIKSKIRKDFLRIKFDTEEEFNDYVTETKADLSGLIQDFADKGLSGNPRPVNGNPVATEKALSASVDAWLAETKPAEAAK